MIEEIVKTKTKIEENIEITLDYGQNYWRKSRKVKQFGRIRAAVKPQDNNQREPKARWITVPLEPSSSSPLTPHPHHFNQRGSRPSHARSPVHPQRKPPHCGESNSAPCH